MSSMSALPITKGHRWKRWCSSQKRLNTPCREDRKQALQSSPGFWYEIKLSLEEELGRRTRGVHTSVVLVRTLSRWSLLQSWFSIGAQEILLKVESQFLQDCCSCLELVDLSEGSVARLSVGTMFRAVTVGFMKVFFPFLFYIFLMGRGLGK